MPNFILMRHEVKIYGFSLSPLTAHPKPAGAIFRERRYLSFSAEQLIIQQNASDEALDRNQAPRFIGVQRLSPPNAFFWGGIQEMRCFSFF